MQRTSKLLTDTIVAMLAITIVIFSTMLAAGRLLESPLYRQSRIVSMLVQQESFDLSGMLEDTRGIELVVKFAGALATAYINFELIPVGEAATFVSIFESLNDNVEIDGFEYRRKDLYITGTAATKSDYESFLQSLRARGDFASIEGGGYDSTDGNIKFEIICISAVTEAYLNF